MKLLAIVGQQGSGKDVAAEYLAKHFGLLHIPSGDILRDYIRSNSLGSLERDNLQRVITTLRIEQGNDVLVRLAIAHITAKNVIISGLRHPDEIRYLKSYGGRIIAITAEAKIRYQRSKRHNREGDSISFEKFVELEKNENHGGAWNIEEVINQADYIIKNNDGYKKFLVCLDEVMTKLGYPKKS